MIDYLLGLATLPVLGLLGLTAWEVWAYFTDRSTSHGCGTTRLKQPTKTRGIA